jgi:RNA polymerase sigma-70 factor (ECF subfamily)
MSICTRYVNDVSEAKSIMNQGFFKIFKNLQKFDTNYDFRPWLKTIMVNTALDHIKRNKKMALHTELKESSNHVVNETAIDKMSFDDLIKIVNLLPAAYRIVFNLFVIDGYKHEEIAEQLGIGVGTSKSNLSRAKEKLRSMVREKMVIA